jgi:hypothetical protein
VRPVWPDVSASPPEAMSGQLDGCRAAPQMRIARRRVLPLMRACDCSGKRVGRRKLMAFSTIGALSLDKRALRHMLISEIPHTTAPPWATLKPTCTFWSSCARDSWPARTLLPSVLLTMLVASIILWSQ